MSTQDSSDHHCSIRLDFDFHGGSTGSNPVGGASHLEHISALFLREQPDHRRDLAHLDAIPTQSCEDAVQAWHVAALDQRRPPVEMTTEGRRSLSRQDEGRCVQCLSLVFVSSPVVESDDRRRPIMDQKPVVVGIADYQPELFDKLRRTQARVAVVPLLAIQEAVAS